MNEFPQSRQDIPEENLGFDFAGEISEKGLPDDVREELKTHLARYANVGEFGKLKIESYRKLDRGNGLSRYMMPGVITVLPGDMPPTSARVMVVIETLADPNAGPYRGGGTKSVVRSEIIKRTD